MSANLVCRWSVKSVQRRENAGAPVSSRERGGRLDKLGVTGSSPVPPIELTANRQLPFSARKPELSRCHHRPSGRAAVALYGSHCGRGRATDRDRGRLIGSARLTEAELLFEQLAERGDPAFELVLRERGVAEHECV